MTSHWNRHGAQSPEGGCSEGQVIQTKGPAWHPSTLALEHAGQSQEGLCLSPSFSQALVREAPAGKGAAEYTLLWGLQQEGKGISVVCLANTVM